LHTLYFFFVFLLGETKGEARQTILEQDSSSLRRWSHSAVRKTTFKISPSPFPPPPLRCQRLDVAGRLLKSYLVDPRAHAIIGRTILLIDKPADFFPPRSFRHIPSGSSSHSHNLPCPLSPFPVHFYFYHHSLTSHPSRLPFSTITHSLPSRDSTSSVIGCLPTLLQPQERYNDRTNRFLTNMHEFTRRNKQGGACAEFDDNPPVEATCGQLITPPPVLEGEIGWPWLS